MMLRPNRLLPVVCFLTPELELAFGQDNGVTFDLRYHSEPPPLVDFLALVLIGFGWLLYWRRLKRWARSRAFCYRFPTAMLGAFTSLNWFTDWTQSVTSLGYLFECLGVIVTLMNVPALFGVEVFGGLTEEHLPLWIGLPYAALVFWTSWHVLLRFFRWRSLLETPLALNISKTVSSSEKK
jgi:hypothetical protein